MTLCIYGSRLTRKPKAGTPVDPLSLGDWRAVFSTRHNFDAHAWPYVAYDGPDPANPQVRVESVSGVPVSENLLLCGLIFLDYDRSNDYSDILETFYALPDDHPLRQTAAVHPTLGGMRFIYRLAEPVTVEEFGPLVRGLSMRLYLETQLQVDPSTDQWWRCFRLPSVVRADGKADGPTWMQGYWFETLLSDAVLDPASIEPRQDPLPWAVRGQGLGAYEPADRPDIDGQLSDSVKRAYRRALRKSVFRFYDIVFEDLDIPEGRRDETLLTMTGEVVARCFSGVPNSTQEEIFLLLVPCALRLRPDGSEAWPDKLWRMVQHAWAGETKKKQDREKVVAVDLSKRQALLELLLANLPAEIVPNDPVDREIFASRHLCLQTATGAHVIQGDGTYSLRPLRTSQLPAHFNDGLGFLAPDRFRAPTGQQISGQEILNRHSTIVHEVEYVAAQTQFAKFEQRGDMRVLRVSPFCLRPDLVESAELDQEIGEWLDRFQDSRTLIRWLASALALDKGPTAALYLTGPARAGKSMLGMALAECFGAAPTTGAQAFSDFNGRLLESPIILVDEGLPTRVSGMDTADLFRSLVTGSGLSAQKKYQDAVNLQIPYRIIFAANSFDMVTQLIGKRNLGAHDRGAFEERILVVETGHRPGDYLDGKGAMSFTRYDKKGAWIGGACRLARHLIRLYQMHCEESDFTRDGRMLVEGQRHMGFTLAFDLSGPGRTVVDDLIDAISKLAQKKGISPQLTKALEITSGVVWIRKRPFVKMACYGVGGQIPAYAKALDRFCTEATKTSPSDMTTMYKVDVQKLIYCGRSEGLDVSPLAQLQAQAEGVR